MNKKLTLLLSLTFLVSIFILTSCASRPENRFAYFRDGKEVECYENDCKVNQDRLYCNVFAETGTPPPNFRRSSSDTSSKVTSHSGTITDPSSGSMYSYRGTSRKQTDFMQQGLNDMSTALGNLARRRQYEQRVENRYYECMNIMMGYDLVRVPLQQNVPSKPVKPMDKQNEGVRNDLYDHYRRHHPESQLGKWYDGPTIDFEKDMDKYK